MGFIVQTKDGSFLHQVGGGGANLINGKLNVPHCGVYWIDEYHQVVLIVIKRHSEKGFDKSISLQCVSYHQHKIPLKNSIPLYVNKTALN